MEKLPKFSIITPCHLWREDRVEFFLRCVDSVRNQTFKDFEWIVVNDGSTMPFLWESIKDIARIIDKPHEERVIAANRGMKEARGEWFCFLDSDDEYESFYLEKVNQMIEKYPEYKMFNFGAKYINKDGSIKLRDPFEPKKLEVGHEIFGGGNIVNGTFVFHRSVYEDLGAYPPSVVKDIDCSEINYGGVRDLQMCTPYDFSAYAQIQFPEVRQFFMVDHEAEPHKIIKELGNPWGQDWFIAYKYTRKYYMKPIMEYLYVVHPR